uniref:Uncharacterized protein n=1 Tax=Neobodo designis TaxID=312471 RepID=A0A7S1W9C3_NEODS|mmetsp:Transcript_7606/g.23726  ORF Transcript_7606/g.23726 Transcript_7606/m.23726 type:complete len:470 (+) Transcript_7606:120-1529(+)
MLLEPLVETWRHTFPKDLRFSRYAIMLKSELNEVARRYKDKKFVPRGELQAVADNWIDPPYSWQRLPVLRQLSLSAWINVYRTRQRGQPNWLLSRGAKVEHERLVAWLDREGNARMYLPREQFEREVMEPFHTAVLYHYMFLTGAAFAFLLGLFLISCYNAEPLTYFSLVYGRKLTPKQIVDWYEQVMLNHANTEQPEAYRDAMPPTAFVRPGEDMVCFNVIELVSPTRDCRVTFIPFPRVGPREFFLKAGSIMKNHQAVLMEELNMEQLRVTPPAYYFPLKDEPFPALGIHHRYYDILEGGDRVPPRLLPGATPPEWYDKYIFGIVPFPIKTIYKPYGFLGTRSDARAGWGRLKDALFDERLVSIAVPWTPMQITNLKCSLYKEGWTVGRVESIEWMRPRAVGEHFLEYYGIEETDEHRARDAAREAAEAELRAAQEEAKRARPVTATKMALVGPEVGDGKTAAPAAA